MPVTTAANISLIRFAEQAGTPSTPAAGFSGIYMKADGLYAIDDAGAVTGPFGVSDLTAAIILDPTSSARNIILPTAGDYIPLTLRGYASAQTASLLEIKEGSAGTIVHSVSGTGAALFQNFTDSTSGFKILDKDGGTPIFNVDTTNERVGVGTATPGSIVHVYKDNTTTSGTFMTNLDYDWTPSGATSNQSSISLWVEAYHRGTGNSNTGTGYLAAIEALANISGTGVQNTRAINIQNINDDAGTVVLMDSLYIESIANQGGGAITTAHGIYIEDQDEATTNYSIYTNAGHTVFNAANGAGNTTIGGTSVSANYDLGLVGDGVLMLKETTTPTADTNYGKLYTKNDNVLYFQDGAGAEHAITMS